MIVAAGYLLVGAWLGLSLGRRRPVPVAPATPDRTLLETGAPPAG
jgi:hypothetical protein